MCSFVIKICFLCPILWSKSVKNRRILQFFWFFTVFFVFGERSFVILMPYYVVLARLPKNGTNFVLLFWVYGCVNRWSKS